MIETIRDPLFSTIVPQLNNQALSSFALTSKFTYEVSYQEIFKRSTENQNWLKAILFLKRKYCSFMGNKAEPLLKKIEAILQRFSKSLNFTFLPSYLFKEEVLEKLKENFNHLFVNKKLNYFYTCLQADDENEQTLQFLQNLLEEYESFRQIYLSGPSEIYLDVNQPTLSLGSLVCFSINEKNRGKFKDLSKIYDSSEDPCHFIDSLWHTSIYLKELREPEPLKFPLSLLKLSEQVSSLAELRLLQINWESQNLDRSELYFQSILEGSISLLKLQCIHFNIGYVTDQQIRVILESLGPLFRRKINNLSLIIFDCKDIRLDQAVALVQGIDQIVAVTAEDVEMDSRKELLLFLNVEAKTCRHKGELGHIFDYPPQFIEFMYGLIS